MTHSSQSSLGGSSNSHSDSDNEQYNGAAQRTVTRLSTLKGVDKHVRSVVQALTELEYSEAVLEAAERHKVGKSKIYWYF